jgi:hypothetical protein
MSNSFLLIDQIDPKRKHKLLTIINLNEIEIIDTYAGDVNVKLKTGRDAVFSFDDMSKAKVVNMEKIIEIFSKM